MAANNDITSAEAGLALETKPSEGGKAQDGTTYDAVFGEITEEGPDYRAVGWFGSSMLMTKTQFGLGVLTMPIAFDALGMIPGVVLLCLMAAITTWTGYVVGTFKLAHPAIYNIGDAVAVMFGRLGREFFSAAFILFYCVSASSGMLSVSIGLNAVSTHGACTALFVAIAAILGITIGSVRTLARLTWFAWLGVVCVVVAILTVTIGVGVQDRPDNAPQDGVWKSDYELVNKPTFTQAVNAVSQFLMAYGGIPAYFPIVAEMREPRHYTRSLLLCQGLITAMYIMTGCVIYFYCGSYVSSPALGSAGRTVKKISYGFALPGLIATTVLCVHYAGKSIFVRLLQGTKHLTANTPRHWITWFSCTIGTAGIAYIIASSVPSFGSLASLMGALFGTLMSITPMGCMWLYDNWGAGRHQPTLRWVLMVSWSMFVIVGGLFLLVAGTYAAILDMKETYALPGQPRPFTCADNSNST